jgi:hypothetical protein
MNHYCDIWFWRASDQAEVARHLTGRTQMTGEPDTPRHAGLLRSALLPLLRMGRGWRSSRSRETTRAGGDPGTG